MSLKLKRNIPLVVSLFTVVLILTVFFGDLRVGAYNIRINLNSAGDTVSVPTESSSSIAASASSSTTAGDTNSEDPTSQLAQPVIGFEQVVDTTY